MKIEVAIKHAIDGRAILFAGAGFSIGAINLRDQPFKVGSQLAQHFLMN
jgi:hypothetical protein